MAKSRDAVFDLLYSTYKTNPNLFTHEDIGFLRGRAKDLGVDFTPESTDVNLVRSAQQALYGFINGFTTLEVGDQPRNEVETLFHNIGHLAGFMGFIPGAGSVARIAATGFAKGAGLFLAKSVSKDVIQGNIMRAFGKSLPMMGADWIMKGASSFVAKNAALESLSFLKNGSVFRDVVRGATHLGLASGISAAPSIPIIQWDWALEERLQALIGGAEAGAVFKVLGNTITPNLIKGLGPKLGVSGEFVDDISKINATTNVARAVAASMYMGIPATLRGDPTLLQVYEYIAGGAFGIMEKSVHQRQAGEFLRHVKTDIDLYNVLKEKPSIQGWDNLTPDAQELVKASAEFTHGKLISKLDPYLNEIGITDVSVGGIIGAKGVDAALKRIKEDLSSGKIDGRTAKEYGVALDYVARNSQYREEGMDDVTASSRAIEDIAGDKQRTVQIQNELDGIQLKANAEANALSVLDTFMSDMVIRDINDTIRETGADPRFINPLYDFARSVQQKPIEGQPLISEGQFRLRTMKDSIKLLAKTVSENKGVEEYIGKMKTLYGDMDEATAGRLKQIWLNVYDTAVQPQMSVRVGDGSLIDTSETQPDGTRSMERRPVSYAEDVISRVLGEQERVTFINKAYEPRKNKDGSTHNKIVKVYDAIDIDVKSESALPGLFVSAHSTDMMVYGGMKANDRIVLNRSLVKELGVEPDIETGQQFVRYGVGDSEVTFTLKEKLDSANDVITGMNADRVARGEKPIDDAYVSYEKQYGEFAKVFREHSDQKFKTMPEAQLRRMFEKNYVNNIVLIEQLNGGSHPRDFMPWEAIIANPDRFISNVQELNKRNQVIFAGEHRINPEYFTKKIESTSTRPIPEFKSTNEAIDFGKTASKSEITEMQKMRERFLKESQTEQDRQKKFDSAFKAQFLREAIEANEKGVPAIPGITFDAAGKPLLNYVIIDSKNAINVNNGPIEAFEMRNGKPTRVQKDTHLDGAFIMRNDVFDAIMDFAGLSKETGHQKGTIVHTEAGKGMVIGKFAYHRAAPEIDAMMMRDGVHFHAYDTAIKQIGFREKNGLEYVPEQGYRYIGERVNLEQIPVDALSINFSAGEHPDSQFSNQKAVVQLYSNLNLQQAPKYVLDEMFDYIKSLGFSGNAEQNALFKGYEATMRAAGELEGKQKFEEAQAVKKSFSIDKIKVEDLGFAETIRLLKDPYLSKTPLYDKLMRHILRLDREGGLRDGDVVDAETQALEDGLMSARSGAMRAFELASEITPAMTEVDPVGSNYAQRVITAYLMNKAKRPEMPYSMKAVMSPYQLEMQHKYNLQPGEYMLDGGMRKKKIEFHTDVDKVEEVTLEQAWKRYNKAMSEPAGKQTEKDFELISLWENDLTHAVIRVPADSMSGIRMLRFRGFTDIEKGYGILLHPEDMTNLGGADLDIDSAFIYTKLPKSVKDTYASDASMFEWYRNFKYDRQSNSFILDGKGQPIETTRDDPQSVRVLQPAKTLMKEIIAVEDGHIAELKKHPMSMFNPVVNVKVNRDTYNSNSILGPGLYHTRRLASVYDMRGGGNVYFRPKSSLGRMFSAKLARDLNINADEISVTNITGILNKDTNILRAATRDIVNFGADAEGKYLSADDIATLSNDKAFNTLRFEYNVRDKKGAANASFKELMTFARSNGVQEPLFLAFGNPDYSYLQRLDKMAKTYDHEAGERLTIDGMRYGERPIVMQQHEQYAPANIWHRIARDMSMAIRDNMPERPLATQVFGKEWTGIYSYNEKRYKEGTKARLMKWFNSKDPLAEVMRRFTFRRFTNFATNEKEEPWAKAQDAWDAVTIGNVKQAGERAMQAGYKLSELEKVAQEIDEFKRLNAKRLWEVRESTQDIKDQYKSRDLQKSDLYRRIVDRFKQWYSQSQELGNFASTWYTGTLKTQPQSMDEFLRPLKKKMESLKSQVDSAIGEDKKKAQRDYDEVVQEYKDQKDLWNHTNFGAIGVNSPFVPDAIIKSYYDDFNKLVSSTWHGDLAEAEIKEVLARTGKGVSEAMKAVQPEAVAFNQTSKVPELVNQGDVKRFTQSYFASIPHLAKMEINKKYQSLADDIADLLYRHPNLIPHFNEKLMGPLSETFNMVPTLPNIIPIERLKQSVDLLKQTIDSPGKMKLAWYDWFLPPSVVANKLTPYDPNEFVFKVVPTITGVTDAGAVTRDLPIRTFFSSMELMRRNANASEKLINIDKDAYDRLWNENNWLYRALGKDAYPLAQAVTSIREEGRGRSSAENAAYYGLEAEAGRKELEKFKGKTWTVARPDGQTVRMTLDDVVAEFKRSGFTEAERGHQNWVYNASLDSYMNKVLAGRRDFTPQEAEIAKWVVFNEHGLMNLEQTFSRFQHAYIEERFYEVPKLSWEFIARIQWQDALMRTNFPTLNGGKGGRIKDLPVPEGMNADVYHSKVLRDMLNDPSVNRDGKLNFSTLRDKKIFFDEYHPHVGHSTKAIKLAEEQRIAALKKAGYGEDVLQQKEMEVKNEADRLRHTEFRINDEMEPNYELDTIPLDLWMRGGLSFTPKNIQARSKEFGPIPTYDKTPLAWIKYNQSMARAYYKGLEAWINYKRVEKFEREKPLGENNEAWAAYLHTYRRSNLGLPSLFPKEWLERKDFYIKNNAYYMFTDQAMYNFLSRAEKKLGSKFVPGSEMNWDKYRQIIHENGGFGQINTPLNLASRDLHLMSEKSKIGEKIQVMGREKPEAVLVGDGASQRSIAQAYDYAEQAQIPIMWRNRFDSALKPLKKGPDINYTALSDARRYSAALARFSMLEGKFNLVSLLSHTKTMIANLTTAGTNTAISTGLGTMRRASDLKYISSVMPNIKSMDDLNKFREQAGALEAFIKQEIGENVGYGESVKRFINEGLDLLKKNPDIRDQTIMDLAKKYKLSDSIVDKAAWFMRTSEVIARGNSWMAHYLKGREVLGANNYLFPTDAHPWLIRFANRGVESTQFLYNNANKPMFAQTSLGKVFFRFQQWAMSSMVMRAEIAKQAGMLGYKPGTEQYEKYQRLLMADMFMLGLATLFPATFFDSNLAPPFQYMVDLADWAFGDKRDRDRAFYGALPYPTNLINPVMPPIARIPTSVFHAMISDDWDRFLDYHLYTWFPFGRIGRDIKKTIESPTMIIENFTNIPIHQMERENRRIRDDQSAKQMFHSFMNDALTLPFE